MKKEGNMRITSYNKFFAEVAQIMNTSVKAVKQLEGRYKIELSNNVHFYVFRSVTGGLFIHDHRGAEPIISCYNFEDFKTIKDLYKRLVSDYSVQPNKTIIAKIENINHCPNQNTCCIVSPFVHCNYSYKSDSCIKAKSNPEWHHVSLATLANIDIDMLDEKRQRYFKIYKELIKTLNDLHKCKIAATYETRWWRFKQVIADDINYRGTTLYMTRFLDSKISMCNVECGLWSSADEKATSFIKSRRYGCATLK